WGYAGETPGGIANDLTSIVADPNVSMHEAKSFTVNVRAGRLPRPQAVADVRSAGRPDVMNDLVQIGTDIKNAFSRPEPPEAQEETGFFTDTSLCIGCKACEVACKQWNQLPVDNMQLSGKSYDNTVMLTDTTWRH